jgi:hypothetical protein
MGFGASLSDNGKGRGTLGTHIRTKTSLLRYLCQKPRRCTINAKGFQRRLGQYLARRRFDRWGGVAASFPQPLWRIGYSLGEGLGAAMVRPVNADTVTDHGLLVDVGANDHHDAVTTERVLVNSQAIAGLSVYELRLALDASGHRIAWGVLRGVISTNILGHEGVFFLAHATPDQSCAIGIRAYGSGGLTSYVGAYSRLHGDSYLSHDGTFGPSIRLEDAWIDGSDLVLEFRNIAATSQNLTVYGTVVVK